VYLNNKSEQTSPTSQKSNKNSKSNQVNNEMKIEVINGANIYKQGKPNNDEQSKPKYIEYNNNNNNKNNNMNHNSNHKSPTKDYQQQSGNQVVLDNNKNMKNIYSSGSTPTSTSSPSLPETITPTSN